MTDYGYNVRVRNSAEDAASREGRWRIPDTADGRKIRQFDYVVHDDANPGFVKLAPASTVPTPGVAGLNVQSSGWYPELGRQEIDSHERGFCKPGLTSVWSGAVGIKVQFKNTAAKTLGTRQIPAQTRLKGTITVGTYVTFDPTDQTYVGASATTRSQALGQIVSASADGDTAEIVFF